MFFRRNGFRLLSRSQNSNDSENKDFFERNPSKIQFWATIIVLVASVVYSNLSLKETRKAYDLSKGQLVLAKIQFDTLKAEKYRDDKASIKKEQQESELYKIDSARIAKRDSFQKVSFKQQLRVNEQQLAAIKTQAEVANKQMLNQDRINKMQLNINRPIFSIAELLADSTKDKEAMFARFNIVNSGKRVAKVMRSKVMVWNEGYAYFQPTETLGESDLNPDRVSIIEAKANITKAMFKDKTSFYYIVIYYYDDDEPKEKRYTKFFKWHREPNNVFTWESVLPEDTLKFTNMIRLKKLAIKNLTD